MPSEYIGNPFGVHGKGKGHRIVLIFRSQGNRRHGNEFFVIQNTSLMALGAPDYDSILPPLDNPQIKVGVFLLPRFQAPVSPGVGHGAVDHDVFLLHPLQEILETLMVRSAVFLVCLVADTVKSVESIPAHAALGTFSSFLSHKANEFYLVHQIFNRSVNRDVSVDPFVDQWGRGGEEALILGVVSIPKGQGRPVCRSLNQRMIDYLIHSFSEDENFWFLLAYATPIFCFCTNSHFNLLIFLYCKGTFFSIFLIQ